MKPAELELVRELLDEKTVEYNRRDFIQDDPIQIPHRFSRKEDIEISGLLAATIAWGNRKSIINSASSLMERMDHAPYQFITDHTEADLNVFKGFVHRTFNADDARWFVQGLQYIYSEKGGLENVFNHPSALEGIEAFREAMFTMPHAPRSEKHIASPMKGSSAKRLNMYLRWMVRQDTDGVDFGLWDFPPAQLMVPLDVHTGRVARELGILKRKQNDWKAVEELMEILRKFDPDDPVKYDLALFGMGIDEKKVDRS